MPVRRYLREPEAGRYRGRPPQPGKLAAFEGYVVARVASAVPEQLAQGLQVLIGGGGGGGVEGWFDWFVVCWFDPLFVGLLLCYALLLAFWFINCIFGCHRRR